MPLCPGRCGCGDSAPVGPSPATSCWAARSWCCWASCMARGSGVPCCCSCGEPGCGCCPGWWGGAGCAASPSSWELQAPACAAISISIAISCRRSWLLLKGEGDALAAPAAAPGSAGCWAGLARGCCGQQTSGEGPGHCAGGPAQRGEGATLQLFSASLSLRLGVGGTGDSRRGLQACCTCCRTQHRCETAPGWLGLGVDACCCCCCC